MHLEFGSYLTSFFHPHRCAFTSGDEDLDICHKAFVTLVASQVQTDAQEMAGHKEHVMAAVELLNLKVRPNTAARFRRSFAKQQ